MTICSTCSDTHRMPLGDGEVPCTRCPTPCRDCASQRGAGAYCASTPCPCSCHRGANERSALEAAAYLRAEADFNPSWADGRRGADRNFSEAYKARRLELALERERWADAIEALCKRREELTR